MKFLTALFLFCFLSVASAADYKFEVIEFPNSAYTIAEGINDNGDIVGTYAEEEFSRSKGFVYRAGEFSPLNVFDALSTVPFAINRRGAIVGTYLNPEGQHAFIQDAKGVTTTLLDVPRANGINAKGHVVGYYAGENGSQTAYIYVNGVITPIVTDTDIPNILGSAATSINDKDHVVGYYFFDAGACCVEVHGFLRRGTSIFTIDVPFVGSFWTTPMGINNNGDIVGFYLSEFGNGSFFYDGRTRQWSMIESPGASNIIVLGINGKRQIVGYYNEDTTGKLSSFIGTPAPVRAGRR